jgi:hypothetical protein
MSGSVAALAEVLLTTSRVRAELRYTAASVTDDPAAVSRLIEQSRVDTVLAHAPSREQLTDYAICSLATCAGAEPRIVAWCHERLAALLAGQLNRRPLQIDNSDARKPTRSRFLCYGL